MVLEVSDETVRRILSPLLLPRATVSRLECGPGSECPARFPTRNSMKILAQAISTGLGLMYWSLVAANARHLYRNRERPQLRPSAQPEDRSG
jgi:hypothetical protein